MASRPGLYANINKRKKAGTSRSKKKSTISAKSYKNMKAGFPNSKKNKAKRKRKKAEAVSRSRKQQRMLDAFTKPSKARRR